MRVLLYEDEIRALIMPFPGDVSSSYYWHDYLEARDARARGVEAIRHATESRTRYARSPDLETPGDSGGVEVLMLSEEAEALLMPYPGDDDPPEYWELFHDTRRLARAVARENLKRVLEDHRRATA